MERCPWLPVRPSRGMFCPAPQRLPGGEAPLTNKFSLKLHPYLTFLPPLPLPTLSHLLPEILFTDKLPAPLKLHCGDPRLSYLLGVGSIFSPPVHSYCLVTTLAASTGMEKVSFYSNPKERQCQRMFKLPHNCTHFTC